MKDVLPHTAILAIRDEEHCRRSLRNPPLLFLLVLQPWQKKEVSTTQNSKDFKDEGLNPNQRTESSEAQQGARKALIIS